MKDVSDRLLAEGGIEGCANGAFVDTVPLMACDAADAYNLERIGQDRYRLTLAVPGFDEAEIDVSAYGGFLRIKGRSGLAEAEGDVLHRGLDATLDRTFLMTHPLDVIRVEARCGLLRIVLREQPGAGVQAMIPPRFQDVEAVALAA